jgi:hypothetical protein
MGIRVQSKDELPGYPVMTESMVTPLVGDTTIDGLGENAILESSRSEVVRTRGEGASRKVRCSFRGSPK